MLESTLKKASTVVTAPCNMSPEMVKGEAYTIKADIWALGCLIFEMASLKVYMPLLSRHTHTITCLNYMI